MKKRVITIGREFGSGGRTIGRQVAEKLGIAFYDRDIIKNIVKETGLKEKYVEHYGEFAPSSDHRFAYSFVDLKMRNPRRSSGCGMLAQRSSASLRRRRPASLSEAVRIIF